MSGWADRKIQEAADKQKDERDKNEKQAREHALALADAPVLWDQLLQLRFSFSCDAPFNYINSIQHFFNT